MSSAVERFDMWPSAVAWGTPAPSAVALLRSLLDGARLTYIRAGSHSASGATWFEVYVPPNCVSTLLAVHEAYAAVMGPGFGLSPDEVSRAREMITQEDKCNDTDPTT